MFLFYDYCPSLLIASAFAEELWKYFEVNVRQFESFYFAEI